MRPRVSLIIVHFRTPDVLRLSLERIAEAAITLPYEVIVIDNAPLDDSAERLCSESPQVRYRRNERNIGFGRGVNEGIEIACGEFYLILNPDVEVQPGSVEELVAEMERDRSVGLVAPKLVYPDGTLQHSCRTFYTLPVFLLRRTFLGRLLPNSRILREHLMLDYDHATTRQVDWCLGASLLVRRAAVDDVGPMDERFFLYFEDVDWCYRLSARGWKVLYDPASVMIHRYERASAQRPGRGLLIHLASTFRYYEKWSFLLYWLKRRSSSIRRGALIISDLIALNGAFVLAYVARNLAGPLLTNPTFGFGRYVRFLLFTDVVALLALALAGMYRSRRREEAGEQVLGAVRAIAATALVVMASTFLFFTPVYSRAVVGLFLPLAFALILLFRWFLFSLQGSVRSRRLHLRRIGVLAPGEEAEELKRRLAAHAELGFELLPLTTRAAVLDTPRGGDPGAVEETVVLWVHDERIAEVVLFEDWPGGPAEALIERLAREGIPVRLVPRAREALRHGARMGDFLGFPALQVSGASLVGRFWEKRLFDATSALAAILLLAVPFLLARTALALAGRPMEARDRIGRLGRRLHLSRLPGPWPRGPLFTGIREFPTLWLWLRGEWSLVGIFPFEAEHWSKLPEAYRRSPPDAPPGWITLAGDGEGRSLSDRCLANREYVGRWSPALDMHLVLERLRPRKENR